MLTTTHAESYARTEAGKAEIRAHGIKLSRPARNLLMVIDASCSGDAWVGKVNGSTRSDLEVLIAAGLVAPQASHRMKTVHQRVGVEVAVREWK